MKKVYLLIIVLCCISFAGFAGMQQGRFAGRAPGPGAVVRSETITNVQLPPSEKGAYPVFGGNLYPMVSAHTLNSIYYLSCTENSPAGSVPGTGVFLAYFEAVDYCSSAI